MFLLFRSNRALINVWIPSVFLRGRAANAFHVYQVITWFSVRRHCWAGGHTCLLLSGAFASWRWSAIRRSHNLQMPASTCPTSPRKGSFWQTEGGRVELSRAVGPPSVAVTPQLGLLEQKWDLLACVATETSRRGSGLRPAWTCGQMSAPISPGFLCLGVLFRPAPSVGGPGTSQQHQTLSLSGHLSGVCLGSQAHP